MHQSEAGTFFQSLDPRQAFFQRDPVGCSCISFWLEAQVRMPSATVRIWGKADMAVA